MKLIVGLGNPGSEYVNTRHNIGFMVLDKLINKFGYNKIVNKFKGSAFFVDINNKKVIFLKPETYMNLSGECISEFINFYKINIKEMLVIYDDKDLDINQIKWRAKGSSGGHNGLKSIISKINSEEFYRIKIGVGRPPNKNHDTAKWVLSKLNSNELNIVNHNIDFLIPGIEEFINNIKFNDISTKYSRLKKEENEK